MNPLSPLHELRVRQVDHCYSHACSYGAYEIHVSPSTQVGWFQQTLGSRRGTLRFERGTLVDVEGCDILPQDVVMGLRQSGFRVPV